MRLVRTFVHERVRDVIADAYAALTQGRPGTRYIYGETGLPAGGGMRPHRTHQNGLSVDFMVPVLDGRNRSVPLPASLTNKFGYGLDFDVPGRAGQARYASTTTRWPHICTPWPKQRGATRSASHWSSSILP